MDEFLFVWIQRHRESDESALYLDEQLVMSNLFVDQDFMLK